MSKGNKTSEKDIVARLLEARTIIDECIATLPKSKARRGGSPPTKTARAKSAQPAKLDFGLNERNFIKTHAKGLSGPKKFTLLLAYVAKGKVGVEIELSTLRPMWNKMTSKNLMRYAFNLKYPNEAKTQGWIDSKKAGVYHLRQGWLGIFD